MEHFPRYWPFVRRIHRSPVNSPHKGQWRGALMISLICAWTKGEVNNRDARCVEGCQIDVISSSGDSVWKARFLGWGCLINSHSVRDTSPYFQVVGKDSFLESRADYSYHFPVLSVRWHWVVPHARGGRWELRTGLWMVAHGRGEKGGNPWFFPSHQPRMISVTGSSEIDHFEWLLWKIISHGHLIAGIFIMGPHKYALYDYLILVRPALIKLILFQTLKFIFAFVI